MMQFEINKRWFFYQQIVVVQKYVHRSSYFFDVRYQTKSYV